jgi:hypothetical protein
VHKIIKNAFYKVHMNTLLEQSEYLFNNTTLNFKRFLFNEIECIDSLVLKITVKYFLVNNYADV